MRELLHRLTGRCPVHGRPSLRRIRELEASLGIAPLAIRPGPSFVEEFADARLIICGRSWCRSRRVVQG
jgi:hypothetical protein